MTDVLSGLLQGVDRGFSNGLDLYKTVQDEARQKRLEQYQLKRDAIADQRYEQTWENNLQRQRVADEQWGKTHKENVRKTDADIEHNKGVLGVYQQNARTSAGRLDLERQQKQYVMDEDQRIRRVDNAQKLLGASLLDDDGAYITDPAVYAARANQNPQVLKATIDLAVEHGLLDPKRAAGYTGAQLVPTPQGLALRVAGVDAKGNPIKPGGGILSQNGTSDPDDPYVLVGIDQLRALADPKFVEAQRSNALARDQIAATEGEYAHAEQATLGSYKGHIEQATADIRQGEARLAQLQAEREKLPATVSQPALAGGIGGGAGLPRTNPEAARIDNEIKTLSAALKDKEDTVAAYMSQAQQVPAQLGKERDARVGAIKSSARLQGENYATHQRTLAEAAPAAHAKAVKAAEERYDKIVDTVIKDNVFKPRKGEPAPLVDAPQFRVMLMNVDPAVMQRIGSSRRFEAAAYDVARHVAKTGITGDISMLLEASAKGANLDAYSQIMAAPQKPGETLEGRHAAAVEVGKAKAATPDADVDTLAGRLYMP